MQDYTAEKIRQDFVSPLLTIIGELNTLANELDSAAKSGELPYDYLPLNYGMPLRSIGQIKKLSREIRDKLDGAKDGLKIWRAADLARQKERYAAKKASSGKKGT
jgi:hypothetical protein